MTGPTRSQNIKRLLLRRYAMALTLIGLSIIASNVLIQRAISAQEADARVINIAGRQRMLSQKITKETLLILSDDLGLSSVNESPLASDFQKWKDSHDLLIDGSDSLDIEPGYNSEAVIDLFKDLQPHFENIENAVIGVLSNSNLSDEESDELVTLLRKGEREFLPLMDEIVRQYEADASAKVAGLASVELALLLFSLGILLVEALFIFRPTIRIIGDYIDQIKQQNRQLEKAKIQADQASEAKSNFLANMSHEIRTPLNSVIGFSDILMKSDLDSHHKEYLGYIGHSADSLLDLINDILDFSKIEAGKLELNIEDTNMDDLSSGIMDIIRLKTNEKGVELLLKNDPKMPERLQVDPIRLRQVLINLLGNAVKFTDQGYIMLETRILEKDDKGLYTIEFSVEDTGIGVHPDKHQQIFGAFSQEDASTTRKFGGTGLGLSITNSLLQLMNSEGLQLESEVGKGSRFSFTIQAKAAKELSSDQKEIVLSSFKNVLILDDVKKNCEILREMLRMKGISSLSFSDPLAAIDHLRKTQSEELPDLIISDYQMRKMNGIEFISHVRNTLNISSISTKIILLHSLPNDTEISPLYKQLKVNKAISKPITSRRLYDLMVSLESDSEDAPKAIARSKVISTESPRILMVDDNRTNLVLLKTMLGKLLPNAELHQAMNGEEAVEAFNRFLPDLTFMDLQMPKMSGYEASRMIRSQHPEEHKTIWALTAETLQGEEERCKEAGMDGYLKKPLTLESLTKELSELFPAN